MRAVRSLSPQVEALLQAVRNGDILLGTQETWLAVILGESEPEASNVALMFWKVACDS